MAPHIRNTFKYLLCAVLEVGDRIFTLAEVLIDSDS